MTRVDEQGCYDDRHLIVEPNRDESAQCLPLRLRKQDRHRRVAHVSDLMSRVSGLMSHVLSLGSRSSTRLANLLPRSRNLISVSGRRTPPRALPLVCRREGKPERRHPARKGRPGTREGAGIVRPDTPARDGVGSERGYRKRPSGRDRVEGHPAGRFWPAGGTRTVERPLALTASASRGRDRRNGNTPRGRKLPRGFSRPGPVGPFGYTQRHGMARRFAQRRRDHRH